MPLEPLGIPAHFLSSDLPYIKCKHRNTSTQQPSICRVPRLQPLQHHLAYHSGLCFPGGAVVKSPSANAGDARGAGSIPALGRSPWTRKWQLTPIFLPGKLHGQRSLVGYSTWGCNESDRTEHTHTHTPSYSTLKSRDITLPTKVCLVKAMVFPMSCVDVRVGL